ncbi:MAG: hypothetical protein Q4Q58_06170 [Thermoplasmata archaeon]|nr:hypothetical protein [Thermoplasmata archaeon]
MSDAVFIAPDVMERAKVLADSRGMSVSDYLNIILMEVFDEDELDYERCKAACEEYDRNPISYSLSDSKRRLGLE